MSDAAILVEGLGKKYHIGGRQARYRTLRESITDVFATPFRRAAAVLRGRQAVGADEEIWALKDVSFEIKRGEVVGIIGRNGAGKSTLLKIISRITEPSVGRIGVKGRVGSLLEVGTGFHPELTGRENIYLNGAILGMKREEIRKKFDAIVSFAEIDQFLDTQVKHYSSGMYMRLAFAVAAHLEPDILLIDEVLAVGDLAFQKKCLGKMEDVAGEGRTVLFVSHNMNAVRALCRRGLLLSQGRLLATGESPVITVRYEQEARLSLIDATTAVHDPSHRRGSGAARFTSVRVEDKDGVARYDFEVGEHLRLRLSYRVLQEVRGLYVLFALRGGFSNEIVTDARHAVVAHSVPRDSTGDILIEVDTRNLRPGTYPLYLWLGDHLATTAYDVVDGLSAPLVLSTTRSFEDLGYDPSVAVGFFSVDSRLVQP